MTPSHLRSLADRVSGATGADTNAMRGLGREVLLACDKGYVSPLYAWHNPMLSLDAARGLVPDGLGWEAGGGEGRAGHARVITRTGEPKSYRSNSATPALALTAAALLARATLADQERPNADPS